jgi:glycosyltransferase involved in cell wall biosynthesis
MPDSFFKFPLVSVLMLTFNHEKYLLEAIEGVLKQETDFDFELIISDDCSTDKTEEIVKKIIDSDPKGYIIKYIKHKKNIGMYANGLFVFNEGNGEYLALCEGDDYWVDPFKLQNQVDLLKIRPDATMCVGLSNILKNNNKISHLNTNISHRKTNDLIFFNDILTTYFHTSTYLIKKECLPYLLSFSGVIPLSDTVIRYLLISKGPFVLYNEIVSVYRFSGEGMWTSLSKEKQYLAHYDLYTSLYKYHISNHSKHYIKSKFVFATKLFKFYLSKGEFFNSIFYFFKAIKSLFNYIIYLK